MVSKEEHLLLLLLAVFVLQARCQHKPQVSMSPSFSPIFSGDSINLICDSRTDSFVTWYFNNDVVQMQRYETLSIAAVAPKHSGSYQCEAIGQRSDAFSIYVLDYLPPAVLSIKTGQPVMQTNDAFSLELQSEDGVQGWQCSVNKNGRVRRITFKSVKGLDRVTFQPRSLTGPEAMYWCHDNTTQRRSGQVTIRTSGKAVSMEMLPRPAVVGENLTLKCLAWGTHQISRTIFYKDEKVIQDGHSSTYQIHNVSEVAQGKYKCDATFTFRGSTGGPPYNEVSDVQELFVQASPLRAVLSADGGLSCSCPHCPRGASYRWYHKERSQPFALLSTGQSYLEPTLDGVYACRAVWTDRRTSLSNILVYAHPGGGVLPSVPAMVIVLVAILLLVGMFLVIYRWWKKKRDDTERVYEDVALRQVSPGENEYEQLRKKDGAREEYETLQPEAMGKEKKEGEYQALERQEGKEGVYHTLGAGEGAGGEGGYQALGTRDKDKEYETLGGGGEMKAEQ